MSAPMEDLMGNPVAEHTFDSSDDSDVEIAVVDDRPEDDQVEPRVSFDDDDVSEIEEVGGRAQKRIKKLKYEWHEERRSKEAAERMSEEAVRYAEHIAQENQNLKSLLHKGESVLLSEMKSRADSDLAAARINYKTAYEEGDPEKLVEAQEALTRSQYDKEVAERTVPQPPRQTMAPPVRQESPPPESDPKLKGWLQNNEWFGKDTEMTSFAYGVHEDLVTNKGVNPQTEEYYSRIDDRLRRVFPDKFGVEVGAEEPSASRRTNTVVASASRSSGRPRKVQLTSTQVDLAKRLGITPEQYAKQLLKER
tara:strand:- start:806 stop:1729 length:924 start_codon:yes stop_codon:yes gene_type:complete